MENIEIKTNREPSQIIFDLPTEKEIIKVNQEGFWYKGELVENSSEVYKRFKEWLGAARKIDNLD